MKNLNKRTKIILAIVGVVIVIAVIGLAITQPPASELLGTTALVITPSNPTIIIGDSIVLSVNSVYNCNWFTSSTVVASFVGDSTEVKSVTVTGNAEGLVTINANCGLINVNKAMTIVTVNRPPTPTPTPPPTPTPTGLWLSPANASVREDDLVNYTVQNATQNTACRNWSSDLGDISAGSSNNTAILRADWVGRGYVRVTCDGVVINTSVTITPRNRLSGFR